MVKEIKNEETKEEKVKEETMATIRIILYGEDRPKVAGKCIVCDKNSDKLGN